MFYFSNSNKLFLSLSVFALSSGITQAVQSGLHATQELATSIIESSSPYLINSGLSSDFKGTPDKTKILGLAGLMILTALVAGYAIRRSQQERQPARNVDRFIPELATPLLARSRNEQPHPDAAATGPN